jgi:hypothetical protein
MEKRRKVGYVPGEQVYTTRIIRRTSTTSFTEREERARETTDSRGVLPPRSKPESTGEGRGHGNGIKISRYEKNVR